MKLNVPARGRRFSRKTIIIVVLLVLFIVGGFLYAGYLSFSYVPPPPKEKAAEPARKSYSNTDIFRMPKDEPEIEQKAMETKKAQEAIEEQREEEQRPRISIEDAAKLKASEAAWNKYYSNKLAIEQQRLQSLIAGRESPWLNKQAARGQQDGAASGQQSTVAGGQAGTSGVYSSSQEKTGFANLQGRSGLNYVHSMREGMIAPYQVMEGTYIQAETEGGITSGLPITVSSKVWRNVHCAVPGGLSDEVCIPVGTKAILTYNTKYVQGECRAQAAIDRLIFPDNSSMNLDHMPVGDEVGFAGMADECQTHLGARLLNALLFSLVQGAAGMVQSALGADQPAVSTSPIESEAQRELRQGQQRPPTIVINPGFRFTIVAHKDILFDEPYEPMVQ